MRGVPRPNSIAALVRRGALAAAALSLVGASSASAGTWFVAPDGTGTACNSATPCSFAYAVQHVNSGGAGNLGGPGDDISVGPGTYSVDAGSGLATHSAVHIEGQRADETTINFTSTGSTALRIAANGSASDLTMTSSGGLVAFSDGSKGSRLIARSAAGTACEVGALGVTIDNSVCDSTGYVGAFAGDNVAQSPGNPIQFRNDTIIGGARGLDLFPSDVAQTVQLYNTIVYTTSADPAACTVFSGSGNANITLTTDHSAFPPISTTCAGMRLTQDRNGDLTTQPPVFADLGANDFREAPTSPTINAGDPGAVQNGDLDLARLSRTILGTTDIGAYEFVQPPDVTPHAPDLTATTATIHMTVNNHRLASSTLPQWGVVTSDENFASGSVDLTPREGDQQADYEITGLEPNTTYLWSACTLTNGGNLCLPDQTFTTLPLPPAITGPSADTLTATGATLHATVNPNDGATAVHFEYGTDVTYGTSTAAVQLAAGHAGQPVATPIMGLQPGTTYHARVVAVSPGGAVNGSDFTFTTKAARPAITGIPTISGSPIVGQTLTCSPPTFTSLGDPSPRTTLAWLRDGTQVATGSTYQLVADDSGRQVTCRVTVTNSAGSAAASSVSVTPTAPPGHLAPTITVTPGQSLTISRSTRSGTVAASCVGAAGATCTVAGELFGPGKLPAGIARAKRRPKTAVLVGTVSGSILAGESGTLTVKLTRQGLHRLVISRHLRVQVVARVSDAAGGLSQLLAGLRLKPAKPKHRKASLSRSDRLELG